MIGAGHLLYRAARKLFDRDVAIIAAIVFCLHQVVIFESIDVRPYAFAALTVNASIFTLVRLRHSNSTWLAALFGLSAACIAYFHFLFVVILPALAISFIALRIGDRKILWRQLGVALVSFGVPAGDLRVAVHVSLQRHPCLGSISKAGRLRRDSRHGWLGLC